MRLLRFSSLCSMTVALGPAALLPEPPLFSSPNLAQLGQTESLAPSMNTGLVLGTFFPHISQIMSLQCKNQH